MKCQQCDSDAEFEVLVSDAETKHLCHPHSIELLSEYADPISRCFKDSSSEIQIYPLFRRIAGTP